MERIKIKYLKDIKPLIRKGDWIDLRAAEDVELKKWELKKIPLGVAMELPEGCEAIVAARSSTPKNSMLSRRMELELLIIIIAVIRTNGDLWHLLLKIP